MVEGSAQTMIGERLEQAGARWLVEDADAMAGRCSLRYGDHWASYWASPD